MKSVKPRACKVASPPLPSGHITAPTKMNLHVVNKFTYALSE